MTVVGDVSRLEDLDLLYAVVKEKHGHIDILFANAGAGTIAPLAAATEAHFDQTFDVNVKGVLLYGAEGTSPPQRWRLDHPDLFSLERARYRVLPLAAYAASKAAVRNFARGWTPGIERPQDPRELYEPPEQSIPRPWRRRRALPLNGSSKRSPAIHHADPNGSQGQARRSRGCRHVHSPPMKVLTSPAWI